MSVPPVPLKPKQSIPFYAALLDSISSSSSATDNRLSLLRQAHASVIAAGLSDHSLLRTKLSALYARLFSPSTAFLLFSFSHRRSTFLYNSLLRSFVSLRLFSPALSLFNHLLLSGTQPDHRTLAALLQSSTGLGSIRLVQASHSIAVVLGYAAHPVVSNTAVSAYSKCGEVGHARKLFDRMPVKNMVTWTVMIAALGANGFGVEAVEVFDKMAAGGEIRPDGKAIAAVLAACCKSGLVEEGKRVFGMMVEGRFGVRPGVEHYTAMLGLLGKAGLVEEMEELANEMDAEPDEALWRVVAGACKLNGRYDVLDNIMRGRIGVEWDEQQQQQQLHNSSDLSATSESQMASGS